MLNSYQSSRTNVSYTDNSSVSTNTRINAVRPRFIKFNGEFHPVIVNINEIRAVHWTKHWWRDQKGDYQDGCYLVELENGDNYYCTEGIEDIYARLGEIGEQTDTTTTNPNNNIGEKQTNNTES